MNRRSFLGSILAAAVAPAIVRADSLMRIVPRSALVLDPYFRDVVACGQIGAGDFTMEWWTRLPPSFVTVADLPLREYYDAVPFFEFEIAAPRLDQTKK